MAEQPSHRVGQLLGCGGGVAESLARSMPGKPRRDRALLLEMTLDAVIVPLTPW